MREISISDTRLRISHVSRVFLSPRRAFYLHLKQIGKRDSRVRLLTAHDDEIVIVSRRVRWLYALAQLRYAVLGAHQRIQNGHERQVLRPWTDLGETRTEIRPRTC